MTIDTLPIEKGLSLRWLSPKVEQHAREEVVEEIAIVSDA